LDSNRIRLRTSNLVTGALSLKTSNLNISGGGGGDVGTIDPALSPTSTNAVQNKAIYEALEDKASTSHTHSTSQITDWNNATSQFLTAHQTLKTVNGENLVGEGNIEIGGGGAPITVDNALSTDSTNPVQNKVITTALNAKANTSALPTKTSDLQNDSGFITSADVPSGSSNFIGTFASTNDLPQNASDGNYAYVGASAPYSIYSYNSSRTPKWYSTGATVDTNTLTADEEDITASETGVLSLKDREDTTYSSKAYIRVRKNIQENIQVKKTYADSEVTWVHAVEDTGRNVSTATAESGYNSNTDFFEGNPYEYDQYLELPITDENKGFPFAGKKSVRRSAPCITLNKSDKKVYFKWQYYKGNWEYNDIYYNEWYESDVDFSIDTINHTPKTFGYVENGKKHYIHFDGYNFSTTDATWQQTVNTLPDGTFGTANTIYDIMYDIDLLGNTITPADGVVIRYCGGKIKNGTIKLRRSVIIDCPDVQFFENVTILKAYQVLKDIWFDDMWLALSGVTNTQNDFACIAISLSKDHTIDFKHGQISAFDGNGRKLTIYGNGNKITIDNTYRQSGGFLFSCYNVALYDLNIELQDLDIQTYDAIFDTANILMRNVSYIGYSRIAANHSRAHYRFAALELHDCDLRSTAFLFEGFFNKVKFYNCKLRYINPVVRQLYELISVGASVANTTVDECYVEAYDTYIGGVWEIAPGTGLNSNGDVVTNYYESSWVSAYTYSYMKFHNCELVRFATDNGEKRRGNTNVIYENCHFKACNMPWRGSCIGTVTYKNCWIDMFNGVVGTNDEGPFNFWNLKSATFEGCTFRKIAWVDPEVTKVGNTSYPQGYAYEPLKNPVITIAPPTSIVVNRTGDTELKEGEEWDFKLYLYGNRIIVNDDLLVTPTNEYRPYSHFFIRTVNPKDAQSGNIVSLSDEDIKKMVVSKGNVFVHSISGTSGRFYESVGCHMYFNSREKVIPVDNTVFTVPPSNTAAGDIDYGTQTDFMCCNTNFTFIDAGADIPRYGRYNATTKKVAWLTYSAEEDVPANT
jgi:hypothetical protein